MHQYLAVLADNQVAVEEGGAAIPDFLADAHADDHVARPGGVPDRVDLGPVDVQRLGREGAEEGVVLRGRT